METTSGTLGLTIPIQTLSSSKEVKLTPADVKIWRNALPMADLGETSKKVYHAISDCNKVNLKAEERFEILELLRTPIQFACQSLRKHYSNQPTALTKQQATIANLSQTLQLEMAYGYKIIIEQLANTPTSEISNKLLPIALQRVSLYFSQIILRSYQLYYGIPKDVWREFHLIYRYAEKNSFSEKTTLANEYKRILLMACSYPYQWRQNEQNAIYRATELWAPLVVLSNQQPDTSKPGFLVFDTSVDKSPVSPTRGIIEFSTSCSSLDLNPIVNRLQDLLATIEPNELQARISHSNEAEYALSTPVLRGIIKEWGKLASRAHERTECLEPVKICIGLRSTHFYVNNEKAFQMGKTQQMNMGNDSEELPGGSLPSVGIEVEEENSEGAVETNIDFSEVSEPTKDDSSNAYTFYSCMMVNETPLGYALLFSGDVCPPVQTGEVIGLKQENGDQALIEVCVIRWLKYTSENELRLGIERLSTQTKASGIQLIKEGRAVGDYLRCLIFDNTLLTPTLPFKSGSEVAILQEEGETSKAFELSKLLDTTSSYKRFEFVEKKIDIKEQEEQKKEEAEEKQQQEERRKDDKFDSVWSDL